MTYHPLSNDTGGTPEDRVNEAAKILVMLDGLEDQMSAAERNFITNISNAKDVSPKQLFWLRDIKDKYI